MPKAVRPAHDLGMWGEDLAAKFLSKKGYKIVARGYRFHRGEIDIIAHDRRSLVFVEVKTRTSVNFGQPEESVTPSKQRQLRKIAQAYLVVNSLHDVACRFDIVSLWLDKEGNPHMTHILNAF
jgi:putative endonuclease